MEKKAPKGVWKPKVLTGESLSKGQQTEVILISQTKYDKKEMQDDEGNKTMNDEVILLSSPQENEES